MTQGDGCRQGRGSGFTCSFRGRIRSLICVHRGWTPLRSRASFKQPRFGAHRAREDTQQRKKKKHIPKACSECQQARQTAARRLSPKKQADVSFRGLYLITVYACVLAAIFHFLCCICVIACSFQRARIRVMHVARGRPAAASCAEYASLLRSHVLKCGGEFQRVRHSYTAAASSSN